MNLTSAAGLALEIKMEDAARRNDKRASILVSPGCLALIADSTQAPRSCVPIRDRERKQMVFGFLKSLNSPEAGYRAIRASYDKHYRLAQSNGIEPVSMGLFGALGSRYKLRGCFVNDMVHMMEIAPFMMMDDFARVKDLADYLMADEIPDRIDVTQVRDSINEAIDTTPTDNDAFQMLAAAEPYLSNLPIRWVSWLTKANRRRLHDAYLADQADQ